MPQPSCPSDRLRWFQYRLRTWLLGCVGLGFAWGLIAEQVLTVSRVYHSVRELEQQRAYVVSNFQDRYGLLPGKRSGAQWQPLLEWALASPIEILAVSSKPPQMTEIVSRLEVLTTVRKLNLAGSAITSQDMKRLTNLSKMEQLMLSETAIDDSVSNSLAALTNLRILDLSGTSISDAALPQIASIKSLRWINLLQTNVSAQGLAELQRVRPDLDVTWGDAELTALMPVSISHSMEFEANGVGQSGFARS
jgi:hypothetical protein